MKALALRRTDAFELPIPGGEFWHVRPEDPAVNVMTDFMVTAPITVAESASIDNALEHMRHTGVRSAFATDERRRVVVGLITAYDIVGEKPLRHMHDAEMQRRDVLVWHLMRRVVDWTWLAFDDLSQATVTDVAVLLDSAALSHVTVMAPALDATLRLRGLFSAAKIRRLLAT